MLKILHVYARDLKQAALEHENSIDLVHSEFLIQLIDILEHNEFLSYQSQRIRELYKQMAGEFPYLAFTFKGRIKSLIRAEEKFNGYIVEYVYDYYQKNGSFPEPEELRERLSCFRDLIAYRIVVSMPKCHIKEGENREEIELDHLYQVANMLPDFLDKRGFTAHISGRPKEKHASRLKEELQLYYRDYIENPSPSGYRSLHITLYDNAAGSFIEVQMRTKQMDDFAEIGDANHLGYEKKQEVERSQGGQIPQGICRYFDEALARVKCLQELDLASVDVNMFGAISNSIVNDGCGLYRGRQILPLEHLSRFQNDLID